MRCIVMDDSYRVFVESVKAKLDILSLISEYVDLKKRGGKYWGCCPFHQEKTASFTVTPDKGLFYCFGCNAGGDAIHFVQKIENISFPEAMEVLADKLGVELPASKRSGEYAKKDQAAQEIYKINVLAVEYFTACLEKTKFGKMVSDYLIGRGINQEIIARFSLGAALPNWDALYKSFAKRGVNTDIMLKARLITKRNDGSHLDFFRSRAMIPIKDARGRVVGFGGRILGDGQPKYLNTAESDWFNKGFLLYGLDIALPEIKNKGQSIVVEGYMDAIALHAAGFSHAVASLGTAFTSRQAQLLARTAGEVVFCYDSDMAGRKAAVKAISIARGAGLKVKAILLPDSKDPDEFIGKNGAGAFAALLASAPAGFDFQRDFILSQTDFSSLAGKVEVVSNILPIIAEMKNDIEIRAHVAGLARLLTIDEAAITSELNKYMRDKGAREKDITLAIAPLKEKSSQKEAELQLLGVAAKDEKMLFFIDEKLGEDGFNDTVNQEIFSSLQKQAENKFSREELFAMLSDAGKSRLASILADEDTGADMEQVVSDCLRQVKKAVLERQYEESCVRAAEYGRLGDSRFLPELAKSREIKKLFS